MISINLLPEDIRENIGYSRKNGHLLRHIKLLSMLSLLIVVSFVVCAVFLRESNSFFQNKIAESTQTINSYNPVVSKAHKLEQDTKNIQKIKNSYKYWSKFNAYLNNNVPEGIFLDDVEQNEGKLRITGYAQSKNTVGLFRDALEKSGAFSGVNINSVSEQTDPAGSQKTLNLFQMDMNITNEATDAGAAQ